MERAIGGWNLTTATDLECKLLYAHTLRLTNFLLDAVSMNIEKRCNHYRLIVACMLSGASQDRPVIVGWSTAPRGQVIEEKSLGNSRRNWQPARACWQGPNHHAPNRGRNRVDHRTITGRSWDNFGRSH